VVNITTSVIPSCFMAFSEIPILLLKFSIFYYTSLFPFLMIHLWIIYKLSRDGSSRFTCLQLKFIGRYAYYMTQNFGFMKSAFYRENFKLNTAYIKPFAVDNIGT